MKLRVRSLSSKETLKLEVADTCTVRELKENLSFRLSHGGDSSSSLSPDRLFLTLNRKDELSGPSLQSAGVTSGDLIFYSLNPNLDESCSQIVNLPNQMANLEKLGAENAPGVESKSVAEELIVGDCKIGELADSLQVEAGEKETLDIGHEHPGGEGEGFEDSEVDDDDGDVAPLRSLPVPNFLKNVFEDEIGSSSNGSGNMPLIVAVHAVLLESGFVGFDPVSCTKLDGFRLPARFPSSPLHYTIPELLCFKDVQTVSIRFQSIGKYVNAIGTLANKVFVYRVCLDGPRLIPAFNLVWKNGNNDFSANENIVGDFEKDVFDFWKHVKDGIALPLLIDLCESVGLVPPSCFMLLPNDLKLKILELLPVADIAQVARVCTELRFISSDNMLWRQKYGEEFGNTAGNMDTKRSFKIKFSRAWKRRKAKRESVRRRRIPGFMTPHIEANQAPAALGQQMDGMRQQLDTMLATQEAQSQELAIIRANVEALNQQVAIVRANQEAQMNSFNDYCGRFQGMNFYGCPPPPSQK